MRETKPQNVCFKCAELINENDHYMRFTEFLEGSEVKSDFCHKKCWDTFLNRVGSVTEAQGMLRSLKGSLTKMGLLPPEEVIIQ